MATRDAVYYQRFGAVLGKELVDITDDDLDVSTDTVNLNPINFAISLMGTNFFFPPPPPPPPLLSSP
jgi:hypothetical protein